MQVLLCQQPPAQCDNSHDERERCLESYLAPRKTPETDKLVLARLLGSR